MANNETYIKQALNKYKYADIARRDVSNAMQQFKDLRPSHDSFIFNDGSRKELLNLDGTVPVSYKGNTYNIPICVWILDTHPYNPPMVFVKPTSTMQIKQGRNVDANGKVDLPYLRDWRYPQSDLQGLIQVLVIIFSEEPPVFSRASQVQNRTPYPSQGQPPYPAQGGGFPMPTPNSYQGYQQPTGYPYPGGGQGMQYPSSGFSGYPSQPPNSYPSQPPTSYPSSQPATSQSSGGYPPYTPYPPSVSDTASPLDTTYNNTSYPSQAQGSFNRPGTSNTVTEEHLRMSLLSAVEDKMRRRLRELFEQSNAEMDVLNKTQQDLLKGKEKLQTMVQDLEIEKSDIERNIQLLKEKDGEVKEALSKLESQDKLDVDEAIVTTAPLYRQLLNSFAEEQALEDAIYYLGEALRKDVIDVDVFLKQVRELSRRQFMLRALIMKCREKAGLPPLA